MKMRAFRILSTLLCVACLGGCGPERGARIEQGANKLVTPTRTVISPSGKCSLFRPPDTPDRIMLTCGNEGGHLNPINYSNESERLSWSKAQVAWDESGRIWIVKGNGEIIVWTNAGNNFVCVLPSKLPPQAAMSSVLKGGHP